MKHIVHIMTLSALLVGLPTQAISRSAKQTDLVIRAAWNILVLGTALNGFSKISTLRSISANSMDPVAKFFCEDSISEKKWWGSLQLIYSTVGLYYTYQAYLDYKAEQDAYEQVQEQPVSVEKAEEKPIGTVHIKE